MKRKAIHAGSWYPSAASELTALLEAFMSTPRKCHSVKAIIVPHAGYKYSGSVAGSSFSHITAAKAKRYFVLGPSHKITLPNKIAYSMANALETPLGDLAVDLETLLSLQDKCSNIFERIDVEYDENEHSLEMQYPFIKYINGDALVVPLMIGQLDRNCRRAVVQALSPFFESDENVFIISSDFCHCGKRFDFTQKYPNLPPHHFIEDLDSKAMQVISSKSADAFDRYLDETGNTICGSQPILLLLEVIEGNDKIFIQFIDYHRSSLAQSVSDSSVSYASGLIGLQ